MAYIKVSEAAARLGVTTVTIREYIKRGRLVATRTPGGQWRIEEAALVDMMAKPREKEADYLTKARIAAIKSPHVIQ